MALPVFLPMSLGALVRSAALPQAQRAQALAQGTQSFMANRPTTQQTRTVMPKLPTVPLYNGDALNFERTGESSSQTPTNVLNVLNPLANTLNRYTGYATNIANQGQNLSAQPVSLQTYFRPGSVNLNRGFEGGAAMDQALRGGIDYFGNLGIARGLQDLGAQRTTADNSLAQTLGGNSGNSSLLNVLRGQNLLRSQLASQGLISNAQSGTLERALSRMNAQNAMIQSQNAALMDQAKYNDTSRFTAGQLSNTAQLQQAGYNQQSALAQLQAQLATLQPYQNLLEALTALQGQQRGVVATGTQLGQRNYD